MVKQYKKPKNVSKKRLFLFYLLGVIILIALFVGYWTVVNSITKKEMTSIADQLSPGEDWTQSYENFIPPGPYPAIDMPAPYLIREWTTNSNITEKDLDRILVISGWGSYSTDFCLVASIDKSTQALDTCTKSLRTSDYTVTLRYDNNRYPGEVNSIQLDIKR